MASSRDVKQQYFMTGEVGTLSLYPIPECGMSNGVSWACSGDVKMEPGAVVCRVAPCWVRFGTFQLPASRGDVQLLMVQHLADYVIRHHYPHLEGTAGKC